MSIATIQDIPGLVADVRRELNIDQEQLAAELDISLAELERLEWGDSFPISAKPLRAIEALGLRKHLHKLLTNHGFVVPPFDHLQDFWTNFRDGPRVTTQPPAQHLPTLTTKLLDFRLNFPFGVPACALTPNARYIRFFAQRGFDLITYKTVRDRPWEPHNYPNWGFVPGLTRQVSLDHFDTPVVAKLDPEYLPRDRSQLSMVNSFGVPSWPPEKWQEDVARSKLFLSRGQVLIVSIMGSPETASSEEELTSQFVNTAIMAKEAGADIVEVNLSCPNTENSIICNLPEQSQAIVKAVRDQLSGSGTPVFMKIGWMQSSLLSEVVACCAPYVEGIVGINTISVPVVNAERKQFFPDSEQQGRLANRERAGLSGNAIRNCGLSIATQLVELREQHSYDYVVIGVGGVMSPRDFYSYLDTGVDAVQSCTGAWINHDLAIETRLYETKRQLLTQPSPPYLEEAREVVVRAKRDFVDKMRTPGLEINRTAEGFVVRGPDREDNFTYLEADVEDLETGLNEVVLPIVRGDPEVTLFELVQKSREAFPELPESLSLPWTGLHLLVQWKIAQEYGRHPGLPRDPSLEKVAELLREWYDFDKARKRSLFEHEEV